jgi:predicted RNase H-like HicB family nuclease
MRVRGHARGNGQGTDYSVWLIQVEGGLPYVAIGHGAELEVRSALTGEALDDPDFMTEARNAIALYAWPDAVVTTEQDENGVWHSQAPLAPGIAAVGQGSTREDAAEDCNVALEWLLEKLRASR